MDEQKEPDYDQQYSESFTKKIPFPLLKYETSKLNPTLKNFAYTLATASVHDDTKFTLYTSPETKKALEPITEKLRAENKVKRIEDERLEKEEKEKKRKEKLEQEKKDREKKDEEEDEKGEEKEDEPPAAAEEEPAEKKKVHSNDTVEKALLILNDRRAEERSTKKQENKEREEKKAKEEKKESNLELQELSMQKAKSGNPDDKKGKENALSKENETISFEKIDIDETFNQNLVNCTKILTLWEIKSDGYRKVKEVFLFDNVSSSFAFSEDG